MLVDSHCHLNMQQMSEDLDGVITRAKNSNVKTMLTVCTRLSEFNDIYSIVESHDNIFASVGVHPCHSHEETLDIELLKANAKKKKVIALGETGLDYHYSEQTKDMQFKSFAAHIDISHQTDLPVIIHSRSADSDMADIIASKAKEFDFSGVMHSFSSSVQLAKSALDSGMYISFSGIITFKNAESLRDIVKYVPLNKILVETDSPYLAPVPHRGKVNEPSYVELVARAVAKIKGVEFDGVATATTDNFFKLFYKANAI